MRPFTTWSLPNASFHTMVPFCYESFHITESCRACPVKSGSPFLYRIPFISQSPAGCVLWGQWALSFTVPSYQRILYSHGVLFKLVLSENGFIVCKNTFLHIVASFPGLDLSYLESFCVSVYDYSRLTLQTKDEVLLDQQRNIVVVLWDWFILPVRS